MQVSGVEHRNVLQCWSVTLSWKSSPLLVSFYIGGWLAKNTTQLHFRRVYAEKMNRHWANYSCSPTFSIYHRALQSTAHFVYPTHTHTALNRSGTWRTGRGPETAGLHVRRRDVAAAGITPDCIQSLYLSLAKTAHYTQNHSTPIYPHDLERMRRALRICYCVNPKYLEFTLALYMLLC